MQKKLGGLVEEERSCKEAATYKLSSSWIQEEQPSSGILLTAVSSQVLVHLNGEV